MIPSVHEHYLSQIILYDGQKKDSPVSSKITNQPLASLYTGLRIRAVGEHGAGELRVNIQILNLGLFYDGHAARTRGTVSQNSAQSSKRYYAYTGGRAYARRPDSLVQDLATISRYNVTGLR